MEGREFAYLDTLALAAVTFGGFSVIAAALRPASGFIFGWGLRLPLLLYLARA